MKRMECEKLIREKLVEIKKIYEVYAPDSNYLSLSIMEDSISFNNEYFGNDADTPINYYEVEND